MKKNFCTFVVLIFAFAPLFSYGMTKEDQKLLSFAKALQYGQFQVSVSDQDKDAAYIHYAHYKDESRHYIDSIETAHDRLEKLYMFLNTSSLRLVPLRVLGQASAAFFQVYLYMSDDDLYDSLHDMQQSQEQLVAMRDTLICEGELVPQEIVRRLDTIAGVKKYCEHKAVMACQKPEEIFQDFVDDIKENRLQLIKALEHEDLDALVCAQNRLLHLAQVPVIDASEIGGSENQITATLDRRARQLLRKERRKLQQEE